MKAQGEGLIINISSWAGKHVSVVTGRYTAAKHAMNAHERKHQYGAGVHGVRACAVCPGEVATPILDNRPVPVSAEDRAQMVQPEDCGELIRFWRKCPITSASTILTISPTFNRGYAAQARGWKTNWTVPALEEMLASVHCADGRQQLLDHQLGLFHHVSCTRAIGRRMNLCAPAR